MKKIIILTCNQNWTRSWAPLIEFPQNSFLQFPQKKTDFLKKLLNMKIFSIKFVIKKVILIFGVRWSLLLKNSHVPPKFFWPMCTNFWPTL